MLAATFAAFAQPISFGLKTGSALNDPTNGFSAFGSSTAGRWTGGATFEVHLARRFSIELDALRNTQRSTASYPIKFGPDLNSYLLSSAQQSKAWDFPILLKYRILKGPVKPFVSGGFVWSRETSKYSAIYSCMGPQNSCTPADAPAGFNLNGSFSQSSRFRKGSALGAGVEFQTRYVTISPELRFTSLSRPGTNIATGMVGFTFKRKR